MKCGARVALGVAGGYFLGRTKKMKLALMLAGMSAGRQAGGPGELLKGGTKLLNASPELSRLTDVVRGRLLEAGKGAALAVATRQVESLTDRVGKRVESLGDLGAPRRGKPEDVPDGVPVDEEGPIDEAAPQEGAVVDEGADEQDVDEQDVDEQDVDGQGAEEQDAEEAPAGRPARTPAAATAPAGRGGKNSAATATVRRGAASGAGGGARAAGTAGKAAAGKAAAGRKPARPTRTRRGEGNG